MDNKQPPSDNNFLEVLNKKKSIIQRFWAWLVLLALGSVWGLTFSLAKIAADGGGHPLGIAYWQSLIGAVVLISYTFYSRKFIPFKRRHIIFYILCGILGSAIPNTIFFYAASNISPGILSITVATVPLMTFIAAVLLKFERFVILRVMGVVFGMISIILLVGPEASLPNPGSEVWVLLGIVAAVCYTIENMIIAMRTPEGVGALSTAAGMFLASALIMTPFMFIDGIFVPLVWPLGPVGWSIIGMSAVSVFAYGIFVYMIMQAGPVFASQTAYIVTISGVIWGIIIFDEKHSFWIWISLAVMMIALFCVSPKHKEIKQDGS